MHTNHSVNPEISRCLLLLNEKLAEIYQNCRLYECLLTHAPDEEHKNILTGIHNTEMAHQKLLLQLYSHLTGCVHTVQSAGVFRPPRSYRDGLLRAYRHKTAANLRSLQTARCLQNINQAMCMADMAADEMRHSLLYLHLLKKR